MNKTESIATAQNQSEASIQQSRVINIQYVIQKLCIHNVVCSAESTDQLISVKNIFWPHVRNLNLKIFICVVNLCKSQDSPKHYEDLHQLHFSVD